MQTGISLGKSNAHVTGPGAHPIDAQRRPFDGLTMALHWLTVVLVLALFASAWLREIAEDHHSAVPAALLQAHRSFGVTVWIVTVLRLVWRLTQASLPPFPAHMTALHRAAVKLSEYGLYALLLIQPTTGLLAEVFGGRPFAVFLWRIPPLVPRDALLRTALHSVHEFGAWTLAALALSHAAAALFHHFVLRDDVLECMAPVMRRRARRARRLLLPSPQPSE
jgi:cytochrome b561